MKNKNLLWVCFYIVLIIIIFRNLINFIPLSGGDYITFSPENIAALKTNAFAVWDSSLNLGASTISVLHYAPYNYLIGWIGMLLGSRTGIWERIVWWFPFFIISFFSISFLFKKFFPKNSLSVLAPLIFVFNTYILMILGGGQIAGIGLAYALSPLVLYLFINNINTTPVKNYPVRFTCSVLPALILAVQIMFDLRIAYITMVAVLLYIVLRIRYSFLRENVFRVLRLIVYSLFIPLFITFLLLAYWIFPALIIHQNPLMQLGQNYTSESAVKFFSFANFENALGLLHPNWPDNIFGKVGFMKPEFLALPLLAFMSLLFTKSPEDESKEIVQTKKFFVLFFSLLGLLGIFLAKGANPPFGEIYLWLFNRIPGFIMFRDPTKWYLLVTLSYSVLIPYSLFKIQGFIDVKIESKDKELTDKQAKKQSKIQNYSRTIVIACFIFFFLFLIRPALFGQLKGVFSSKPVPQEYKNLALFLGSQKTFSRTLWLPTYQRFGYISSLHPAVYSQDLFGVSDSKKIISLLKQEKTLQFLQNTGVKYIIVPFDNTGDIFSKDGKYDNTLYLQTVQQVAKIQYLKKLNGFGKIAVFEVSNPKDHFWLSSINSQKRQLPYKIISPSAYEIQLSNINKGDILIFSDAYNPLWTAKTGNDLINSALYDKLFNSFSFQRSGSYKIYVTFEPQKWIYIGLTVSLITLLICATLLITRKSNS